MGKSVASAPEWLVKNWEIDWFFESHLEKKVFGARDLNDLLFDAFWHLEANHNRVEGKFMAMDGRPRQHK